MAQPLEQLTIAILEHRFTKELSTLFERFGAKVYACPLLEEKPVENREELEEFVRQLAAGTFDAMIFLTGVGARLDRKSTRLNSSHQIISYAVFCLKKKI